MKPMLMEMSKKQLAAPPPLSPLVIHVTSKESNAISTIGDMLVRAFGDCENLDYMSDLHLNAFQLLPERIARILSNFGTDFSAFQYGPLIFKGLVDVDHALLGPTPSSWKQ